MASTQLQGSLIVCFVTYVVLKSELDKAPMCLVNYFFKEAVGSFLGEANKLLFVKAF